MPLVLKYDMRPRNIKKKLEENKGNVMLAKNVVCQRRNCIENGSQKRCYCQNNMGKGNIEHVKTMHANKMLELDFFLFVKA